MRALFGRTKSSTANASSLSLSALDEPKHLEDAMKAATLIMNDDVDGAEEGLKDGSSAFHKLGRGVVAFLRATLGFEQEVMREAGERLGEAETAAYTAINHAQRDSKAYRSSIYPPGSEFALIQAEAMLMGAVVGLLNESVTESIKGFYKMRKAYMTLDGIMQAEVKYRNGYSNSTSSLAMHNTHDTESINSDEAEKLAERLDQMELERERTIEANKKPPSITASVGDVDDHPPNSGAPSGVPSATASTTGSGPSTPNASNDPSKKLRPQLGLGNPSRPFIRSYSSYSTPRTATFTDGLDAALESELVLEHPIDVFIHSGSNLCFGVIQLMLGLVPPTFSKLLYIVGFKGDREKGIQMLWRASTFDNVNGAMAGLAILGYYNGLVGICDILPLQGEGAVPKERCKALLQEMRIRYPKSNMWSLEEARMASEEKELERSVELTSKSEGSPLKQVEALKWFENSLNCMYLRRFDQCTESFLKCVKLNNWSHALYYYIAGSAQVEIYRELLQSDPEEALKHAARGEELLKTSIKHTNKTRFIARQLPFDAFVSRKIRKWEARAKEWKCDFVDAIGVSPIEEMIYFWNGYKRMRREHLEESLRRLDWSTGDGNPHWDKEGLEEKAILATLRAVVKRNMGLTEESKQILKDEVLNHEWLEFKGPLKDSWTLPVAHYEMAANIWFDVLENGATHMKLQECESWLEKVSKWESFDLDARIGLKVATGKDTLKKANLQLATSPK